MQLGKDQEEPSFAPEDDEIMQKIKAGQQAKPFQTGEVFDERLHIFEHNGQGSNISEYISTPELLANQSRLNEHYKQSNHTMVTQKMTGDPFHNTQLEVEPLLMASATTGALSPQV